MVNQFTPTEEEIQKIIEKNKNLPQYERTCYKCGHRPCPHCGGNTCDTYMHHVEMLGNWEDYDEDDINEEGDVFPPHDCCNGECSYIL